MSIELAKVWLPVFDEKLTADLATGILDSAGVTAGRAENEITIIKRTVPSTLPDYNKDTGYTAGAIATALETITLTQDKGISLTVDRMTEIEALGTAFGGSFAQYSRETIVPYMDRYTFGKLDTRAGNTEFETLTTGTVVSSLDTAKATMFDLNGASNLVLFMTYTGFNLIKNSTALVRNFSVQMNGGISREFTAFDGIPIVLVNSGVLKDALGNPINYLIVNRDCVIQTKKFVGVKYFTPEQNQSKDAHLLQFRMVHDTIVLDNKVNGIYVSKPAIVS